MKMHRKGQVVSEAVFIIIVLALLVNAVYAVVVSEKHRAVAVSVPEEMLDMHDSVKKFEFYAQEAGNLAVQQAFADVAEEPADCKKIARGEKFLAVWSEGCGPSNSEIKESFLKKTRESFEKHVKENFRVVFEGSNAKFIFEEIKRNVSVKGKFLNYDAEYSFSPLFAVSTPDMDFEKIYFAAMAKKASCNETEDFTLCMAGLEVEGWDVFVEEGGNYLIYDLKTEKSYFYDSGFKPVEILFGIETE